MTEKNINLTLKLGILSLILLSSSILQHNLFMNWDISYMLRASRSMLGSGTYRLDYFNPNPPLIFLLYIPVVLASSAFYIPINTAFKIYIFIILAGSLAMTAKITHQFITKGNRFSFLLTVFAIGFFWVPLNDFGQRDHLVIVLLFPWLLLESTKLFNPNIGAPYSLLCGIMAGIGFSIKPHFVLIFIMYGIYYSFRKKSYYCLLNLENIIIASIIISHIIYTGLAHPDYYATVAPLVFRWYYSAVASPLTSALLNPFIAAAGMTLLIGLSFRQNTPVSAACDFMLIALTGCVVIYLSQRTTYHYHMIPSFILMLSILSLRLIESNNVFTILLCVIPSILIAQCIHTTYVSRSLFKKRIVPLVTFLHKNAFNKKVLFMTTQVDIPFAATALSGSIPAQRYDCLWLAAGISNSNEKKKWPNDLLFYTQMVSEDLSRLKPDWVLVDTQRKKRYMHNNFNYTDSLESNELFRREWKHYHLLYSLKNNLNYQFDAYKREA